MLFSQIARSPATVFSPHEFLYSLSPEFHPSARQRWRVPFAPAERSCGLSRESHVCTRRESRLVRIACLAWSHVSCVSCVSCRIRTSSHEIVITTSCNGCASLSNIASPDYIFMITPTSKDNTIQDAFTSTYLPCPFERVCPCSCKVSTQQTIIRPSSVFIVQLKRFVYNLQRTSKNFGVVFKELRCGTNHTGTYVRRCPI